MATRSSPINLKPETVNTPIVIAIDGPSASGKSTNSRLIAKGLGYAYVDTGAMFRAFAWFCLKRSVNVHDSTAVAAELRDWNATLECVDGQVRLLVDGYFPEKEIRTAETSAAVSPIAAVLEVRMWMKEAQRSCVKFGNLVMEGRDIGTHIFPETPLKFYLDASAEERSRRREAEGVKDDLAARDQRDSTRATAPLKIAADAIVINNAGETPQQTSERMLTEIRRLMAERE